MDCIKQGRQPIARLECAAVPALLFYFRDALRGRQVIWFVDNQAALAALVKGNSRCEINERLVNHFWCLAYSIDVQVWFEFVDSASNWADGISRHFEADEFVRSRGIPVERIAKPFSWLRATVGEMWQQSLSLSK
jgi:hypothetical protein